MPMRGGKTRGRERGLLIIVKSSRQDRRVCLRGATPRRKRSLRNSTVNRDK